MTECDDIIQPAKPRICPCGHELAAHRYEPHSGPDYGGWGWYCAALNESGITCSNDEPCAHLQESIP